MRPITRRTMLSQASIVCVLVTSVLLASLAAGAAPAFANAPGWSIRSFVKPKNLVPGGTGEVVLDVANIGGEVANGSVTPIRISDQLPPGLTATSIRDEGSFGSNGPPCILSSLTCEGGGEVDPDSRLEIAIEVSVDPNVPTPSSGMNVGSVSGGGADPQSSTEPLSFDSTPSGFGVQRFTLEPQNENGSPDTQAGSHPFDLTTSITFNEENPPSVKDLHFDLPPGLIGNPTVVPQCTLEQFSTAPGGDTLINACPNDTAVGVATTFLGFKSKSNQAWGTPLYNLTPNIGEPARFGFDVLGVPVFLDTSIRSGGDYGVVVSVNNISTLEIFAAEQVTFWGVPSDPAHDQSRGWECLFKGLWNGGERLGPCPVTPAGGAKVPPFLTLPTSCTGPLNFTVEADSWAKPGDFGSTEYMWHDGSGPLGMDGCGRLPFEPSISVSPDGQSGSSPTGLTVGVHVPQDASLNPTGNAESDVKDTTVTLPAGVALNPAAADGLTSCGLSEIALESAAEQSCPESSKVGTVEVSTPLLPNRLTGAAYLATQDANPFESLLALYLVARDPVSGVLVKFAGQVTPDPVTGQLVSTFKNTPQLPFEDLKLHFFGGSRAPLGTPALCGSYTTSASIAPWSEIGAVDSTSTFDIVSGPNGSTECGAPLPFRPSLTAGMTSIQAGGFSPFTMTMSRSDGNQNLQAIELKLPPGLSGSLTNVELCGEAQADAGTCGPESLIGETIVSVGLGGDPFSVKGGKVYITGPYRGAPFGLSIVNPAKAGPFDLGNVIVRAKVEVDPVTAALTVTSDNSGPYKIPTILEGIPLQIQHVNVAINRPAFTFNPTNCTKTQVTGAIDSNEGGVSKVAVPFQATNCATLVFKPQFSVSTSGKPSRTDGVGLDVKLSYPSAPFGSQSNIAKVKVELPEQLPSRLTTLQKACPDATFNANPANCPAASTVGEATATSPLVPVQLHGPAYFVSHGGAKFPELIVALSGYGITVDLHGETYISKAGVTSSTFNTVPDVPIESFELKLPAGPDSALAANGDLCTSRLVMPTEFAAQNGMAVNQQTSISVEGCKPALRLLGHSIHGKQVSIRVAAPSAGTLVATGGGIKRSFRRVAKAGTVTIGITLDSHDLRVLTKNPHQRLNTKVTLRLSPTHGERLTAHIRLLVG